MSELREAAQAALNVMMEHRNQILLINEVEGRIYYNTINRLRAALAQPEAEAPIAAKCQRIERSGEICGLTPPCPDCGSSLIDVPEGSL
jgi:hypothetical protein